MKVNKTWMVYGTSYLHFILLLFMNRMLDLPCHEGIRVLLEDSQAGARAKIDPLAAIHGAGIILRVLEFAAAGSFIFRRRGDGGLSQISVILFVGMVFGMADHIPNPEDNHRYCHADHSSDEDQC